MRLMFVRHGESQANVLEVFSNRGWKHGLTALGRVQAQRLAETLAGASVTTIWSSPLLRAVETAEILAARLGVGFATTDALREFDCGVLEGRSDAASWDRYRQLNEAWFIHRRWRERIEEGESFLDIRARFVPFVQGLLASPAENDTAVLVGHGGTYVAMLPEILVNIEGDLVRRLAFENTGTVVAEVRPQGLVCLSWCGQRLEGEG